MTAVSAELADEYSKVGELWALRLLRYTARIINLSPDLMIPIAQILDLPREALVGIKDIDSEMLARLDAQIQTYGDTGLDNDTALSRNVAYLADFLGIDEAASRFLVLCVLARCVPALDGVFDALGRGMASVQLAKRLAVVLKTDPEQMAKAIEPDGKLFSLGILTMAGGRTASLSDRFAFRLGTVRALLTCYTPQEAIIDFWLRRSAPPNCSMDDFAHLTDARDLVRRFLKGAIAGKEKGANVLLYGPPGIGKTELVRVIAQDTATDLFVVPHTDDDGNPMSPHNRLGNLIVGSRLLANSGTTMMLFDEIEDAFDYLRDRKEGTPLTKAWLNNWLENSPVPTVWITNNLRNIDPAFLRRFAIVMKVAAPPRSKRLQLLNRHMDCTELPWANAAVDLRDLTPADIYRAAATLKTAAITDSQVADRSFRLLTDAQLRSRGKSAPASSSRFDNYRLEILETDVRLDGIAKSLGNGRGGNLLFYGPPGTGKTGFGYFLAKQMDRPILARRVSDLLSPYLGVTEERIAEMFGEARDEGAVLMLDEADSFLGDRGQARYIWQTNQTNELLIQMEEFSGVFVCTTNSLDRLDPAALRRFGLKVEFRPLPLPKRLGLLESTLELSSKPLCETARLKARQRLALLDQLTPGDFRAATERLAITGIPLDATTLLKAVEDEHKLKPRAAGPGIGFTT